MKIIEILNTAERPVLIHCYKGVDRTGMVSALALAIEQDPPLPELKKQFSVRYGVFPFYRSIGPSFFAMYEDWLNKTGGIHGKSNLLYWITHEYQDSYHNIQFWIDFINDADLRTDEKKKVILPAVAERILIRGWAFNARTLQPQNDLYIVLGSQEKRKVVLHNRPDLAAYFDLSGEKYQTFNAGWDVEFRRDGFAAGCHEIFLRIMDNGESGHDIPTGRQICME